MIIVTGMQRSGSSFTSQLLRSCAGISFGDPQGFYQADQWNAEGYFEQRDIIDINSRLMTGFPRTQGKVTASLSKLVYATMRHPDRFERRWQSLMDEMKAISSKYRLMAVKDPRFCLTLEYWKRIAQIEAVVVCLRHPYESVMSVKRRDRFPLSLGYRLWNYHMENLLTSLPRERVHFVRFEHLCGKKLSEEIEAIRCFFTIKQPIEQMIAVFRNLYRGELRHIRADFDARVPTNTLEIWRHLIALHADQNRRKDSLALKSPQGASRF